MAYAYVDAGKILHVTSSKETAEEYCKFGKVVETKIPCGGGYPIATYNGNEEEIIVYGPNEMKIDSNDIEINASLFPHLSELYNNCYGG